VAPDGEQIGIKPLPEALTMARELDLDLVEVADKANPPVCRIMDYGKYKYEAAQRAKESRRNSTNVVVKEMKYRPKIGAGDFETKTRKVEHFLDEGHKVKVTIMFRGREMQHPELGKKILDHVADAVAHTGRVEVVPRVDGRNMTMVLVPDRKAQQAHAAAKAAEEEGGEAPATALATAAAAADADTPILDLLEADAPAEPTPADAAPADATPEDATSGDDTTDDPTAGEAPAESD